MSRGAHHKQQPTPATYTIHGMAIDQVSSARYLGLNVDKKLLTSTLTLMTSSPRRLIPPVHFYNAISTTEVARSRRLHCKTYMPGANPAGGAWGGKPPPFLSGKKKGRKKRKGGEKRGKGGGHNDTQKTTYLGILVQRNHKLRTCRYYTARYITVLDTVGSKHGFFEVSTRLQNNVGCIDQSTQNNVGLLQNNCQLKKMDLSLMGTYFFFSCEFSLVIFLDEYQSTVTLWTSKQPSTLFGEKHSGNA